jgi:MtN3 and saliva related transmembrane protein
VSARHAGEALTLEGIAGHARQINTILIEESALPCDYMDMVTLAVLVDWLSPYNEAIGFWAAALTTTAFAPQVIRTWRMGGEGLSWTMLALFGLGVGLWFIYGLVRMSGPLMLANGVTGLQVLVLIALKLWRSGKVVRRYRTGSEAPL